MIAELRLVDGDSECKSEGVVAKLCTGSFKEITESLRLEIMKVMNGKQ